MIVGTVVGAGIYFRTDDIIQYSNGNLWIGILVLALGSLCIVFGSLTLAELAKRYVATGGVNAYFDRFISRRMAAGFGWFQVIVWLPTVAVVVGWASAVYTFMLLDIEATFLQQVLLGFAYNIWFFVMNYWSRNLGGLMQRLSTLVKMIPLILIAVYGVIFTPISHEVLQSATDFGQEFGQWGWLTALLPLIFSYDGWMLSLSITPEVKNPKKNVVRALIISPLIILAIYLLYFYGMFNLMGSQQLLALGDRAIFVIAQQILGERMATIMLLILVISMLGVLNGINLGAIRVPPVLAQQKMIPDWNFSKVNPKTQTSWASTLLLIVLNAIWSVIHYFVMTYQLFNGRDISEISIVFCYVSYLLLYAVVFRMYWQAKNYKKLPIPILASLGSLIILVGSIIASPFYVLLFFMTCFTFVIIGYYYYDNKAIKENL